MSAHADSQRSASTIERQSTRRNVRVDKAQQARLADYAFKRFVANHNREQGC